MLEESGTKRSEIGHKYYIPFISSYTSTHHLPFWSQWHHKIFPGYPDKAYILCLHFQFHFHLSISSSVSISIPISIVPDLPLPAEVMGITVSSTVFMNYFCRNFPPTNSIMRYSILHYVSVAVLVISEPITPKWMRKQPHDDKYLWT